MCMKCGVQALLLWFFKHCVNNNTVSILLHPFNLKPRLFYYLQKEVVRSFIKKERKISRQLDKKDNIRVSRLSVASNRKSAKSTRDAWLTGENVRNTTAAADRDKDGWCDRLDPERSVPVQADRWSQDVTDNDRSWKQERHVETKKNKSFLYKPHGALQLLKHAVTKIHSFKSWDICTGMAVKRTKPLSETTNLTTTKAKAEAFQSEPSFLACSQVRGIQQTLNSRKYTG